MGLATQIFLFFFGRGGLGGERGAKEKTIPPPASWGRDSDATGTSSPRDYRSGGGTGGTGGGVGRGKLRG